MMKTKIKKIVKGDKKSPTSEAKRSLKRKNKRGTTGYVVLHVVIKLK